MKKIFAMIFILGLALMLLGACNAQPQPTASPSAPAATSTPTGAAPTTETPATETPAASTPSADTASGAGLERGTWSDGVYTNNFAKLTFVKPEGWVAATDEELATLMGQAADIFNDEQKWLIEASKLTTIYDTLVQDPATGNNVIIMFENLSKVVGGTNITEKDYLEATAKQLSDLEAMNYAFGEVYSTTVGGVSYAAVRAAEESNNFSQYYLMHKQDKYMVGIIVSVFDDTKIEDILAQFK